METKSVATTWLAALLAAVLAVSLASCENMDKKTIGTVTGGVIGAAVGSQVGHGTGRILAVIAGAALGAYVGSKVGAHLEDKDKKSMGEATQKAADTGQVQRFSNADTGVKGSAEVVKTETQAVKVSDQQTENRECKTIRQTVVTKDNREVQEDVVTCKGPTGWQVVG